MFVTHSATPKQTTPTREPIIIPSLEVLQNMINTGCGDVVEQLILQHKLQLKIVNGRIEDALQGTDKFLAKFITVTPSVLELKESVTKLAKCPNEVLITGETGTGKEILAHAMIGDRIGNFVAVNCAGFPKDLIESELFGHVRGAFTGADSQKQGLFARAKDGVMFLDEIGELPLTAQTKLLRALQDKVIRKVGANDEEPINCKFVCATNRDLKKMQDASLFREDLYARISTLELHIPPLRDRLDDIVPIIKSLKGSGPFLEMFYQLGLRPQDIDLRYNVRSLERVVTRYNVLGKVILG